MRLRTIDTTDERTRLALDRIDHNADLIQQLLDDIRADIARERAARDADQKGADG